MLTFCIYLFSVFLILDCLFLGLLILIQLPKKEAGVGVAFGGGAPTRCLAPVPARP